MGTPPSMQLKADNDAKTLIKRLVASKEPMNCSQSLQSPTRLFRPKAIMKAFSERYSLMGAVCPENNQFRQQPSMVHVLYRNRDVS